MNPFNPEEIKRYARQFPVIGLEGQERLKKAKVFCIGAGGLSAPALMYLTACGLGQLGIIDDDVVELSNLQRQILYDTQDLGKSKALTAEKKLSAQNNLIKFDVHNKKLTAENGAVILAGYDVIIDGSDNYQTRYLVNDLSFKLNIPLISASIYQFQGQCSVFNYKNGPCYRCLYETPPPPDLTPNCAIGGVLGVLPGVMGCIQATEAIKIITQLGDSLSGRLLTFDALNMKFHEYPVHKNSSCPLCAHGKLSTSLFETKADLSQVNEVNPIDLQFELKKNPELFLLDVREPYESEICSIGGILIPSTQFDIANFSVKKDQKIVVYCKAGLRSRAIAKLLILHGYKNVATLKGGIMQWIDDIDQRMDKY